jgi:DNA-binding MarR family transcriptional regulator
MNSVFFGLKRAYYGTLRPTRKPLSGIGMSSARYDMLCAIRRHGKLRQRLLRVVLGVVGATISKMLKSLEKLGFVTRDVAEDDRRHRVVRLTPKGEWAILESENRMAKHEDGFMQGTPFLDIPGADGFFYRLFNWDVKFLWYDGETDRMARELGLAFGPHAKWHPDD